MIEDDFLSETVSAFNAHSTAQPGSRKELLSPTEADWFAGRWSGLK
ncbi:MAG: hypothetical protein H6917_08080 [Novosphingobium sp.]|nr:hypothetical protein [Novosphingobium sp.]